MFVFWYVFVLKHETWNPQHGQMNVYLMLECELSVTLNNDPFLRVTWTIFYKYNLEGVTEWLARWTCNGSLVKT